MQFTGLQDKSERAREIYEGDILEDQVGEKWEVVFDDGAFRLKNRTPGHKSEIYILDQELLDEFDAEVIGDIYSTPDLLK